MNNRPFLWVLKQMRRRMPALILMTVAQISNAVLTVGFALGSRSVIDSAQSGDRDLFFSACIHQALIIAGILVCFAVQRHLRERLRADLEKDWKKRLLHGLLHGDYAAVSAYHSGELLNRLNNDVSKVNEGLLSVIPNTAAMVVRLVAAVVVLGALDAGFTVTVLAVGITVILITSLMRRWLKDINKQVSHHDGKVSSFLQEVMEKLLMVQSMGVSEEVEHRVDALLEERYAVQRKRKNISLFANTGINLMSFGANFLALVWCGGRMLTGQLTFGSLTAVLQLVNQLQTPFVNMSGVIPQYVAMVASAERLMELDAIQGTPEEDEIDAIKVYDQMDAICGEDLSFSYDRDLVLHDASFSIPKGAFCVISGPSGIGKSTLLKLLLGVFRTESGDVFVRTASGNVSLDRSTRRLFAYVPQSNLLLSGTVRDNLLIVRPDATDAELQQAMHASAMDEYIPLLPRGLDTVLGESGAGLSEGQAQRIAIARAVLGGAPILLLDESTSALDAQTEQKVLHRIRMLPGRTCIAVTHRSAAMELCDMRLELQNGKIRVIEK